MKIKLLPLLLIALATSCKQTTTEKVVIDDQILIKCNSALTDGIIIDHFTPPVASRNYMYPNVAAYEALVPFYSNYQTLAGQFKGLKPLPAIDPNLKYCHDLCAMAAFTTVSKKLIYTESYIDTFRQNRLEFYKSQLSEDVLNNSVKFGDSVGKAIIAWSKTDTFPQSRNFSQFMPKNEKEFPSSWQPTSPDFLKGVEPHWNRIKTAFIPTAGHFTLPQPPVYSESNTSAFYAMIKEVVDTTTNMDTFHQETARFWDDNPNVSNHHGHAQFQTLKLTPVGHWMEITTNAIKHKKVGLMESAEAYTKLSAAIFDAFIACWAEKYRVDYIRPITAIRRLINPEWNSFLQTPPFPEFPSGHSSISSAGAEILTDLFGEYTYTDSSEREFGFNDRTFTNFRQAALQCSISRMYGGIHYRPGLEMGVMLGQKIGEYYIKNLKTRKK